jgi:hypothetical protein
MPNVETIEQVLSSFYQVQGSAATKTLKRLSIVISRPASTVAALKYLMQSPKVVIDMSPSQASNARWMYDPRRPWRLRGYISSYLELPSPLDAYWKGTSKQNLRTRTNQAKLAGFKVRAIENSEIMTVIAQVFNEEVRRTETNLRKTNMRKVGVPLDDAVCVGVFDQSEKPIAFSLGIQTGNIVNTLLSSTKQKGGSRWLCFSGFVEEVSARGGKIIIESPPWALTGGNKIFAGHLGFSAGRIRIR